MSGSLLQIGTERCSAVNLSKDFFQASVLHLQLPETLKQTGWVSHTLRTHLTVVHSSQELVAAQRKFWPVVVVHPLPGVVQMLEVMGRHCGERTISVTRAALLKRLNRFQRARARSPSVTQLQKPHWKRRPPSMNCM